MMTGLVESSLAAPPSRASTSTFSPVGRVTDTEAFSAPAVLVIFSTSAVVLASLGLVAPAPTMPRIAVPISSVACLSSISFASRAATIVFIALSMSLLIFPCRARSAALVPKVVAVCSDCCSAAAAFFWLPSSPVMSLNAPDWPSSVSAAPMPVGSGAAGAFCIAMIDPGSSVGVTSAGAARRLSVDTGSSWVGESGIGDSSQRQNLVSSMTSQELHAPMTASAYTPRVGMATRDGSIGVFGS